MFQPTICVDCGSEFMGGTGAQRCQPCKAIRKREIRKNYLGKKYISRHSDGCPGRVVVYYVDGGVDKYGRNTFLAWLQEGAFQPGDEYIMDGERHVVCK